MAGQEPNKNDQTKIIQTNFKKDNLYKLITGNIQKNKQNSVITSSFDFYKNNKQRMPKSIRDSNFNDNIYRKLKAQNNSPKLQSQLGGLRKQLKQMSMANIRIHNGLLRHALPNQDSKNGSVTNWYSNKSNNSGHQKMKGEIKKIKFQKFSNQLNSLNPKANSNMNKSRADNLFLQKMHNQTWNIKENLHYEFRKGSVVVQNQKINMTNLQNLFQSLMVPGNSVTLIVFKNNYFECNLFQILNSIVENKLERKVVMNV